MLFLCIAQFPTGWAICQQSFGSRQFDSKHVERFRSSGPERFRTRYLKTETLQPKTHIEMIIRRFEDFGVDDLGVVDCDNVVIGV